MTDSKKKPEYKQLFIRHQRGKLKCVECFGCGESAKDPETLLTKCKCNERNKI